MIVLRALAAILAALLVAVLAQSALLAFGLGVLRGARAPVYPGWALIKMGAVVVGSAFAGWLCSVIASGARLFSVSVVAVLLGAFVALMSVLPRVGEPIWFAWALPLATVCSVLLAGLRKGVHRGASPLGRGGANA